MLIPKKSLSSLFLNQPLFGQYSSQHPPQKKMRASNLPILIEGIIFSDNPMESSVILKIQNKTSKNYHMGDRLLGATIQQITPDGIILMHNGSLERLNLPKNELLFESIDPALGT